MVYAMQPVDGGPVKIGTSTNVERRRVSLERAYGSRLVVLATFDGGRTEEEELHRRFAHLRLGRTEQFKPAPELMSFLGRPLLAPANADAVEALGSLAARPIAVMTGSAEFKAWVCRLASRDRDTVAKTVERALIHYARHIGFTDEPPKR